MPVSDDIKKEKAKTKDMTFKEKLSYFWYYYKVHTIVALITVFCVVVIINDFLNTKESAFYGVYFNSQTFFSTSEHAENFAEYAGIDTENYRVILDTSMQYKVSEITEASHAAVQKFTAMIASAEIDITIADEELFTNYAVNEVFYDLRKILPEDLMEKYKDKFFYVEQAQIDLANNEEAYFEYENDSEYYTALIENFQNHKDPSTMEDPIPVGIYIGDAPAITNSDCYPHTVPIFGILSNTKRPETAIQYLRFISEEEAVPTN